MEYLTIDSIDRLGTVGVLIGIALLVITDKLVWHTRLKRVIARADKWEAIALAALRSDAQAGVQAAETAVSVVAALPDPQGDRDRARRSEG